MREFLKSLSLGCAFAVAFSATCASAQVVTLKSADGSVTLSGKLLGYNGEFYRLDTKFGEMTLNAMGVICSGNGCPDPGQFAADITIAGASAIGQNLLPGLIEAFGFSTGQKTTRWDSSSDGWTYFVSDAANVPVARIQSKSSGTEAGLTALAEKRTDLALASRTATAKEMKLALSSGIGDLTNPYRKQVLALDGLVFVVSKRNPVAEITLAEVEAILSGKITNWAQLGGPDGQIVIFQPEDTSDLALDLQQTIALPLDALLPSIQRLATADAISDAVAADPFGFGVTTFSQARNAKPLAIKGACGIRVLPTRFGIQAEDYPLSRRLLIYSAKKRLPVFARSFLAWLRTEAAQIAIEGQGFVGQNTEVLPLSAQQDRMTNAIRAAGDGVSLADLQSLVGTFANSVRLSTTFRFTEGTLNLDERSEANIAALARRIEVGDFKDKVLTFAGFSDSLGSVKANDRVSLKRALQVATAVKKAASRANISRVTIEVVGMGEVAPLACDDTRLGRYTNRRVEVWVK